MNDETIEKIRSLANAILALLDEPVAAPAEKKTEAKPITVEDVRAALTRLAGDKGAAAVKALLKDFGAQKLSDIAVQDYPELLAKAEEMGQ